MRHIVLLLSALSLVGCASASKGPAKPSERHRVPINRTLPPELSSQGVTL
jgi:hypothetical protein